MSNRSTRRRFLAQGAGLACAALVGRVPALAAAPADDLTASRFASQINRSFTAKSLASGDAPAVMMRLRSVEPLEHPAPGLTPALARERSFILVFDVDGPGAAQDTYQIENAGTGAFAALLVPDRKGTVLTAVFNRTA